MEYGYVLVWLVAYLALGLAALPVVGRLFDGFRDRGAAFAVPFALATLGLVGFLVGQLPGAYGYPALVAGLAVLAVASYRASDGPVDLRRAAAPAAVFAVAFLFIVGTRSVDPAVNPVGGEKFLNFGLLKTLARSSTLPPEDMWFANEPVQYYYGGYALTVLLADLTLTPLRYAFNLAVAGFYAAFVTAAYGLAAAVADDHGVSGRAAGLLGAFFVAFASNLYVAGRLLAWALPDGLARPVAVALGLPVGETLAWTPADFYYWDASRIITGTANEFPLFAWLNGDLQGHMMSVNFLLLAVAVAYAYWRTPESAVGRRRLLVFGALPALAGLIATINTWSFPTFALGVPFLTLTFAPARPWTLLPGRIRALLPAEVFGAADPVDLDGGERTAADLLRTELARSASALVLAGGVLAIAIGWASPFLLGSASGRPIGLFPPGASLGALVVVHGGFLAAFVPYLAWRVREARRGTLPAVAAGSLLLFGVGVAVGANAVALVGPTLLVAWWLLRTRDGVGFETMLIVAGAGVVVLVEYVYVAEAVYAGTELARFNTVFKLYAQVWALWAPAAAVALVRLGAVGRGSLPSPGRARLAQAGRVLTVLLVVTTATYGMLAVPAHFEAGSATANTQGPTLDATAFVEVTHPDEAPAIEYVDSLEGQPTIVTAAPAGYRWDASAGQGASAPASLTGVPTVAGWFHERQYRTPEAYERRVADVRTIYTGEPTAQRSLIEQYEVEYVYVGPVERAKYGKITVDELPNARAVQRGDVTIYVVEGAGS
jgi:YYY domain-containing protein